MRDAAACPETAGEDAGRHADMADDGERVRRVVRLGGLGASRRGRGSRRARRRRGVIPAIVVLVVLLLPVPWLHVVGDDPMSHAWRLDGRLVVEDQAIDPPGKWSWLAVGRPPLVVEVLRDRVLGSDAPMHDLRAQPTMRRPALNEPAAAAVGLRHAGHDLPLGLLVEARDPVLAGYPEVAVIAELEGVVLDDRAAWDQVSAGWNPTSNAVPRHTVTRTDQVEFRLPDGRSYTAPGPGLPYRQIHTLDVAPSGLEAGTFGKLAQMLPVDWFRNLALGSSHGSMVALTTYAHASGHDLAQGRHIAGTGGIRGDGEVTRIGGLPAKARAARRAGADVMIFPASQANELEDFDARGMTLLPVETLDDAITWLSHPLT